MILEEDAYIKHAGKKGMTRRTNSKNLSRVDRVAAGTKLKQIMIANKKPTLLYNVSAPEVSAKAVKGKNFIQTLMVGGAGYIPVKKIAEALPVS